MTKFEINLNHLLNDEYIGCDDLKNFLHYSIFDDVNSKENQKLFVQLLPDILNRTSEYNYSWINMIHEYSTIPMFLDTFIHYIFLLDDEKFNILFFKFLCDFKCIKFEKRHFKMLFKHIIQYKKHVDFELLYYLIRDTSPDMIPEMLELFIHEKDICDSILIIFTRDNYKYIDILYQNIDVVLQNTSDAKLFFLKEIVSNQPSIYQKVSDYIKEDSRKNIKKLIKSLYLKVAISSNSYRNLSFVYDKQFDKILDIVYFIIDDVCFNERVDIADIQSIGSGAYCSVLQIGDKVVKIGLERVTKRFPNNPYVNAMLLRREFPITKNDSFFVEVCERVDNKCDIDDEELYQLYKKIRDLHLIWLDVAKRNVGRLFKDNKVKWRFELPLSDEILGLAPYRGDEQLKSGDIVILDNDLIYDENDPSFVGKYSTPYRDSFEKRYQKEKVLHKTVEN